MPVKGVISQTESLMKKAEEALSREFAEVRTGRAQPSLVEEMQINYYGTMTPIKQVASVVSPDPSTLLIQAWDPSALAEIEKAILGSKLGITPNNDGKIIRLSIPPLSEERRKEMAKVVKDMAEKGRISLRTIRREANERIVKLHKDSTVSEDLSFKAQEDIQKLTDRFIKDVDVMLERKNKELMTL